MNPAAGHLNHSQTYDEDVSRVDMNTQISNTLDPDTTAMYLKIANPKITDRDNPHLLKHLAKEIKPESMIPSRQIERGIPYRLKKEGKYQGPAIPPQYWQHKQNVHIPKKKEIPANGLVNSSNQENAQNSNLILPSGHFDPPSSQSLPIVPQTQQVVQSQPQVVQSQPQVVQPHKEHTIQSNQVNQSNAQEPNALNSKVVQEIEYLPSQYTQDQSMDNNPLNFQPTENFAQEQDQQQQEILLAQQDNLHDQGVQDYQRENELIEQYPEEQYPEGYGNAYEEQSENSDSFIQKVEERARMESEENERNANYLAQEGGYVSNYADHGDGDGGANDKEKEQDDFQLLQDKREAIRHLKELRSEQNELSKDFVIEDSLEEMQAEILAIHKRNENSRNFEITKGLASMAGNSISLVNVWFKNILPLDTEEEDFIDKWEAMLKKNKGTLMAISKKYFRTSAYENPERSLMIAVGELVLGTVAKNIFLKSNSAEKNSQQPNNHSQIPPQQPVYYSPPPHPYPTYGHANFAPYPPSFQYPPHFSQHQAPQSHHSNHSQSQHQAPQSQPYQAQFQQQPHFQQQPQFQQQQSQQQQQFQPQMYPAYPPPFGFYPTAGQLSQNSYPQNFGSFQHPNEQPYVSSFHQTTHPAYMNPYPPYPQQAPPQPTFRHAKDYYNGQELRSNIPANSNSTNSSPSRQSQSSQHSLQSSQSLKGQQQSLQAPIRKTPTKNSTNSNHSPTPHTVNDNDEDDDDGPVSLVK